MPVPWRMAPSRDGAVANGTTLTRPPAEVKGDAPPGGQNPSGPEYVTPPA